jgi:hypothetical protein
MALKHKLLPLGGPEFCNTSSEPDSTGGAAGGRGSASGETSSGRLSDLLHAAALRATTAA